MKKRFYQHCPQCRKTMTRFDRDTEGDRYFYYCKNCGEIGTLYLERNAWSHVWPKDVIIRAKESGVVFAK